MFKFNLNDRVRSFTGKEYPVVGRSEGVNTGTRYSLLNEETGVVFHKDQSYVEGRWSKALPPITPISEFAIIGQFGGVVAEYTTLESALADIQDGDQGIVRVSYEVLQDMRAA